jgi:hypothetical protein
MLGDEKFYHGMQTFFNQYKFKHPTPADFLRVFEKENDMVLDWYNEYFVNTTKSIDYAVDSTLSHFNANTVVLNRIGSMPMPVEIEIETVDGKFEYWYISLDLMRNSVYPQKASEIQWISAPAWNWVKTNYTITTKQPIKKVTIDPFRKIADLHRENNTWEVK